VKKILLVCTANVCRSPYAAAILGTQLSLMPGQIQVTSAGTKATTGAGLCKDVATALPGIAPVLGDPLAHASSLVDPAAIEAAELILVMELAHRSAVAMISPSARRKTFTLREAARLAQHVQLSPQPDSSERDASGDLQFGEFVAELNSLRGVARLRTRTDAPLWKRIGTRGIDPLDIPDRHNATSGQHRAVLKQVREATEDLAAGLGRLFA